MADPLGEGSTRRSSWSRPPGRLTGERLTPPSATAARRPRASVARVLASEGRQRTRAATGAGAPPRRGRPRRSAVVVKLSTSTTTAQSAVAERRRGPTRARPGSWRGVTSSAWADRATSPRSSYTSDAARPTAPPPSVVRASRQTHSPTGRAYDVHGQLGVHEAPLGRVQGGRGAGGRVDAGEQPLQRATSPRRGRSGTQRPHPDHRRPRAG